MLCIRYLIQFQKGQTEIKALIDSESEVKAMTLAYAAQIGLTTRKTSVGAQKIDGSPLETYGMVSASFSLASRHQYGGGPRNAFPSP